MPNPDFSQHWTLDPELRYLNHGSFGATPRVVLDHQQALRDELEREPVQFLWRNLPDRIDEARHELAKFLGGSSDDLVFVSNATGAVNSVVRSLDWNPGDRLLTTDHAYNACRNVLDYCARRYGLEVDVVTVPFPVESPDRITEAILKAATDRTRLALIDHITSPTALILPVADIVRGLEARGIDTLVDGAHAPGMLALDLDALGAAYYTGNLHKWVCAPKGAAFLHTRRDRQTGIMPPVISHGMNTPREGHSTYQDLFDWPGTFDPTAWLSVSTAIRFMAGLVPGGWAEIRRRNHELLLDARQHLLSVTGILPPCPEELLGSLCTLPLPGKAHIELPAELPGFQYEMHDRDRIEMPIILYGNRYWFRISAQLYNSADDYQVLAETLLKRC